MALNADWHDDPIAKRVSWKPLIEKGGLTLLRIEYIGAVHDSSPMQQDSLSFSSGLLPL